MIALPEHNQNGVKKTMVVREALKQHKKTILIALTVILVSVFGMIGLQKTMNEFSANSSQKENSKTVKDQYLNPDKELEPYIKEAPVGFKTQAIQNTENSKALTFIQPESWEPLESQYLTTSNENVTTVKYGNGNAEFIEIAFGDFTETDMEALILNGGVSKVSTPVTGESDNDTNQNPLFSQIIKNGVTTNATVEPVEETPISPLPANPSPLAASDIVLPPVVSYQQYSIDNKYYFDVFNAVTEGGVSFSAIVHHVQGSGTLNQEEIANMVNSFKVLDI